VRAQGGVTMVPHPSTAPAPAAEELRRHAAAIDCYELASGRMAAAESGGDAGGVMRRLGLLVVAGSGADGPEGVGGACVRMRPFVGRDDFLRALGDAEIVRRRRGLRTRPARQRRPRRRA
jgi:hypothetical protein